MKTKIKFSSILITFIFSFTFQSTTFAQNIYLEEAQNKEIALKIINQSSTCALITIDKNGAPIARMMQTLPTEKGFVIWLATNPKTRKAEHIKVNEKVSVYYTESNATGYVCIQGTAEMVNDMETKKAYWKEGWQAYYPNIETDLVLIKIIPSSLELVSYSKGIISQEKNWEAAKVKF